jgi:hypothetical protein
MPFPLLPKRRCCGSLTASATVRSAVS